MNLILLVFLACASSAFGARILGIFHVPSYSHYAVSGRLMKELARRGHDVTVISPFPQKPPLKNLRDIELTGFVEEFDAQRKHFFEQADLNFLLREVVLNVILLNTTEEVLRHKNVQAFLKANEKFDAVIIEDFVSYALKGFAYHFNAPCIMFSTIGASRMINGQVGNPNLPAYISDFALHYSSGMSFFERFHNVFAHLFGEFLKHVLFIPQHNTILQKYFSGAPRMNQLYYNVSLALVNSHVSTHQPVPYVPNLVDIGGFHIQPSKKLPKDVQEFLDNATDGVIFFSMGSNLHSADMPNNKRDAILRVFSKLKQRVLWKWENEALPGQPANVKIAKWLPQSDILAHPKVRLFLTHGGLLSQIEAIYHGVPVVGIPIYGDQRMNLANAVKNGLGVVVPYQELSEQNLLTAIQEVLNDPKYRENAKRRSRIMHDQPMKPLDRAVYWIEYVIRHQGAPHLRVAALDMEWYQYLLLDLIFFVIGILVAIIVVLWCVVKRTLRKRYNEVSNNKKEQ